MLRLVKSGRITAMPRPPTPAAYKKAFAKRVRAARELSGIHPEEIAKLLGISKDAYLRYESRYMMPVHLIPLFCKITGVSLDRLMTHPAELEARQKAV